MKDGTTLVDELKDKIHDQHDEIARLNKIIKEIDNLVEKTLQEPLVQEDMFDWFYDKYFELKGVDKE